MNALVLHAHPDDELLFAGQLMLSRPEWTWTTVSLTGGARAAMYPGVSLGFEDHWRILTLDEFGAWKRSVEGLHLDPDVVFTHNLMGEYGHPHHMAVHRIAHEVFGNVWDFLCEAPSSIGAQARGPVTFGVRATADKGQAFVGRYGQDTLASLWRHQPALMDAMFTGNERFTGTGPVPA